MTEDEHTKEWESIRDRYIELYGDTAEDIYKHRFDACKRLLGEDEPKTPQADFIQ